MKSNLNKIMGVKSLTNWYYLGIILNSSCDRAKVVGCNGDVASTAAKWQEIKYNNDGSPYVTYRGIKHYLSEFMRVY